MGVGDHSHALAVMFLGRRLQTHCTAGYVCLWDARLDRYVLNLAPPGFKPCTLRPIVCQYTDYAVLATYL